MISAETIERVKEVSIVDLISQTVSLKRAGNNYTGLCPFHQEKSPSFHVKAEQNFFHCFGCGESGNSISFVMKTQNLTFPEAVEYVANKFNIPIVYTNTQKISNEISKTDIYRVNALAYEFYQQNFKRAPDYLRNYLLQRQLLPESCATFGVCYATADWDALHQFLLSRQVSPQLIAESALVKKSSSGRLYDTFRDRLIFPIWIDNARIAGFGGRILRTDQDQPQAKYLNSPETKVYHKSQIFYGLPQALAAIKTRQSVFIVEGYLDVISLHQAGVANVIATCGTALTEDHVKKLNGLTNRVCLLFDGDLAGQAAAAKCFTQMVNFPADIEVLFLPDKQDPDDFAKLHQKNTNAELDNLPRKSLLECFLDEQTKKQGVTKLSQLGAVAKSKLAEQAIKIISAVENTIVRTELLRQLSFFLSIPTADLGKILPVATRSVDPATIEKSENATPEVETLDPLNRYALAYVIIKKSIACEQIFKNSLLLEYLHSSVLTFMSGLQEVDGDDSASLTEKKSAIKSLLSHFPNSWLKFWTESLQQSLDPSFNADLLFRQIQLVAQKSFYKKQLEHHSLLIRQSSSQEDKARLMQEKLQLEKTLDQINKTKI